MRKLQFRLPTAVLASLTLAASLVLPASAAETAGSASHAAAVSVTGMVTASGTADAGVKVTIHAWPDQSIVQSLKVGQVVPWVFVGTATTDASGHYAISLPVAKLMPESSDGVVNLEADTSSAGYSFPVVVTKNAGNAFLAADPVANITRTDTSHCNGVWQYYASLGKHEATVGGDIRARQPGKAAIHLPQAPVLGRGDRVLCFRGQWQFL